MEFTEQYRAFWEEFGQGMPMVLATSLEGRVTARTMSIVRLGEALYFQTDCRMEKYAQLMGNPNVALCAGNIQLTGLCREAGRPADSPEFCRAYERLYPNAYARYTHLPEERLFRVEPRTLERWRYIGGEPYLERFDILGKRYELRAY